ncbi:MAG: hypothetical protein H7Y00_08535 [Fimbriimonadaceae bacterium]|nr:hypothetical protein [Chitinophagales bacterium]
MKIKNKLIIGILFLAALIIFSCKEEIIRIDPEVDVFNPFDTITFENGVMDDVEIDSASFLGLHTFIFKPTCAVLGCHDGSFEPDFRTVQSAYNTLVYHPVSKNDADETYTYRVVPGDVSLSWLYERITTDDATLGRMPLYDTLYPAERQKIIDWIQDGAPDVMGQTHTVSDFEIPTTAGFIAYINDTSGIRIDDNRMEPLSPMLLPDNADIEVWFSAYDFDVNDVFHWGYVLTYNKARISPNAYDFSLYEEFEMELEVEDEPYVGPMYWNPASTIPYYHHFTFNTADYIPGKLYFIRFYVKDEDHLNPTEIPDDGYSPYLITYFSFIVE